MVKSDIALAIVGILLIFGSLGFGVAYGGLDELIFDQIPYNYASYVSLPANSPNAGSLGGYYNISGQGKDFKFFIKLPKAEDSESPLDYTPDGLNGSGHLDHIHITYNTLMHLLNSDLKSAMFDTVFNGSYNMSCAAWVGNGTFSNNGKIFNGSFEINGQLTYWEGTFILNMKDNRIVMDADYILHPVNSPEDVKRVKKTFYM